MNLRTRVSNEGLVGPCGQLCVTGPTMCIWYSLINSEFATSLVKSPIYSRINRCATHDRDYRCNSKLSATALWRCPWNDQQADKVEAQTNALLEVIETLE